jgi:phage-related protein
VARVIGEAKIRLTADGSGLGKTLKQEVQRAVKGAFTKDMFSPADDAADETSKRVGSKFTSMFSSLLKLGSGFASVLGNGLKLAGIGAAAGAAVAGVASLVGVVGGLGAALAQASGAAGLLPAALLGIAAAVATVKIGTQGLGDAFKALASGDMAALQEAMKKLAPSAQQFVKAIAGAKPAFEAMQLDVQQKLFAGLGSEVAKLANNYLPIASRLFGDIATSMNLAAKEALSFANNQETIGQSNILVTNLASAWRNLVPAVQPALSAFLDISEVGSTFLPQLATGVANLSAKFGDFIRNAAATGQLEQFFANALATIQQLGSILADFGSGLVNVFSLANQAGGGFLNTLGQMGESFRAFTESAAGQTAITGFFTAMGDVVRAVLPVIQELATVAGTVLAPILGQLAQTIGPALVPIISALGTALQAAAPGIAALGQGFAKLLEGIAPALPAIGELAAVLGGALGQAAAALGPVLGQLASVLANALGQAIPPLIPVITQLVQIIGQILTAVAPLLPPIITLVSAALGPLLSIIQALVPPFQQLINEVLNALTPLIPVVTETFTALGEALGPLAGALGQAIVSIFTAMLPIIPSLSQAVLALVNAFIPLIPPITQLINILAPIIALFVQMAGTFINFVVQALTPVITAFGQLTGAIGGAMTSIGETISGAVSNITGFFSNLLSNVTGIWQNITGNVTNAVSNVKNFITNGFNAAKDAVANAFTNIKNAVSNGINAAVDFVRGLPGKIVQAIGNLGSLLFNAGRDVLQGLINGITSMVKGVIDKVTQIGKNILNSIKGALGIASPSKEMAKIGVFIGQGLIKGLDKIQPQVDAAAAAMTESMTNVLGASATPTINMTGLTATGAPVGAAAAGGAVLNQTNYMLPGADVKQFADTVLLRAQSDYLTGASTLTVSRAPVQDGVNDQLLSGVSL